ncbi:MAG: pgi, partial [Deltaproteobacteria bacterium]|nr:pgi [Deltaproteobacteria bacterium]
MAITLDLGNVFSDRIGSHGLDRNVLSKHITDLDKYNRELTAAPYPFMKLPKTRFQFAEMKAIVKTLNRKGIKNFVLLGIGGSALGTEAIFNALLNPFHNYDKKTRGKKPRYFIVDNVDPNKINAIIEIVKPEIDKTLLVVISKSGETPETISQFMLFKKLMKKRGGDFQERIILITDKDKGILNKIAKEEGYRTLNVPEGVGGRFSVLTPVGLFPALMMDTPVDEIMNGAQAMFTHIKDNIGMDNMAFTLAAILYSMDKAGKTIHVIMPYCERLSGFADWFRQLESESLGKGGCGPTPTKSMGVTDQHSQLQLYVDGPKDKCVIFLYSAQDIRSIPDSFPYLDDISYLAGKDMRDLFRAEFQGTSLSLTDAGTPNLTLAVKELNGYTLGALFSLFEMVIVYLGVLYKVNAFDQPSVEQGKIYTKAIMGKRGLDKERSKIESLSSLSKTTIIF